MAKFADLLDRKAEDIQRPPLLPIGIYMAKITKPYATSDLKGKEGKMYERREFPCAIMAPVEVDEVDLEEYGNVANQPFRVDWLLDTDEDESAKREMTLFRIKNFLIACGAMGEDDDLRSGLDNGPNCEFGVEIGHRPDPNNPDVFYLEVKKTFNPEDLD
jgi:hypothetical protein